MDSLRKDVFLGLPTVVDVDREPWGPEVDGEGGRTQECEEVRTLLPPLGT